MIYLEVNSIINSKTEVIVNASNGIGIMGAGVAGVIRKAGGIEIQNDAKTVCKGAKINPGDCFVTTSGKLQENGIKYVFHAVTMMYPGGRTSLKILEECMTNILEKAIKNEIKSISIPGLGIGIGGLDKESAANSMMNIAQNYHDKIEIHFVDIDESFIELLKKNVKIEL